jgi:site-specific recombinase XerD
MTKINRFANYNYIKEIQIILDETNFTEKQSKRFEEILIDFKKKQISRNYESILSDVFILFEIENFTTVDLSNVYNISVRSIQKWIKELNLKQLKTKVKKNIPTIKVVRTKKMIFNELPEEMDDFLNYLENIKGKSKNTVIAYKSDLRLFFQFLKLHFKLIEIKDISEFQNIDISDVDIDVINKIKLRDLYAFLNFVDKERNNSSYAKARKVATLKSFFKFLHSKLKVIKNNPADELESPKIEKRLPIYLDLNESLDFLNTLDKNSKHYNRDYCIITLFLNCGLRLSELCNIQTDKIHKDTLLVIGKGNKERTVYLNDSCIRAIDDYILVRDLTKVSLIDKKYLFISQQNKPLNKRTVELLVKKHVKNSDIQSKKITPHKLRHTAATLMYKYGEVDIRALQSILGHENVSTTQIYTHVDDEQLRKAANSNPLSKIKK